MLLFYFLLLAMECLKLIFFCSNQSKTPVLSPQILVVQVFMTILLIASTTSLAMPGVESYKAGKRKREPYGEGKPFDVNDLLLGFALVRYFTFSLNFLLLPPQWAEGIIMQSVLFSEWRMGALVTPRGGSWDLNYSPCPTLLNLLMADTGNYRMVKKNKQTNKKH